MIASDQTVSPKEAHDLASTLRRRVDGEVRFDDGSCALYASDLSMYRQVPIGVVIPRTIDDVVETVAICRERQIPILGARLRNQSGRSNLQRRRRYRLFEVPEQD